MSKTQFLDTPGLARHTNNMFDYIDSKIPTSLPAEGGDSDTVNGHSVESDVPANAKFTDTVYTHPNSGVSAGTYKSVTVDKNGHVTAGTNPTTLSGYGITDAATKTQGAKADTAVQTVKVGDTSYSGTTVSLPAYPTTLPASDVSSWAKASTKPTYTYTEVGADKSGAADDALAEAKEYTDGKVAELLDNSTEAVDSIYELRDAMETNADAIEALTTIAGNKASASDLSTHVNDTTVHITSAERTKWNAAKTHADSAHAPSGAEVNQNAFSKVVIGSTTVSSTGKTDSLTMVAGSNVTITPDATNRKITIAATDTVYTHPSYTAKSSGLYKVTVDSTGHVSAATAVTKSDITGLGIPSENTTYGDATTSASGLMTAAMVTKLNGIATGANAYTLPTATDEILGGVKIGDNITVAEGVISLTKENVTTALGYTPPTSNTVYKHPSYTARTGVPTANQTPAFGGTFNVTQPVSDATGHITAMTTRTVTIPSTVATTDAAGLMSAAMVTKLNGIAEGANAYTLPNATSSVLGGVKIGSNITVSSGTISLTKANVTAALGYTPPKSDTVYTHPSYTARTGVPTANQTPAFGGTFTVSQPVSDATGHITAINSRTITIPSAVATTSANGLMSSTDKTKLNSCLTAKFVSTLPSSPDSNTLYVVSA